MTNLIQTIPLVNERDVVSARQRGRSIAELLGFDHHDQIRIATAVSEIARNAFRYARGGAVAFSVDPFQRIFRVTVTDTGGGIPHLDSVLGGSYRSSTGMGMGILGTKRLMDEFTISPTPSGTTVVFGKALPLTLPILDEARLKRLSTDLARQHPVTPLDELQTQNRELLKTLNELRERKEELVLINSELEDTNRGVVALYAELDERADYLRRASELKSSFLSNMSHEFRTPLNSMLALTRMLLDCMDGELNSEQEQQVRFIQKSAKELSEMVDDLLDIAKVEAGRLEVKARSFDVPDLFGALRGMLKPLLADSSLNLVFEVSEDLPEMFTDEQKVSQVLRNFISNAIKFTPRGEVRVTARSLGSFVEFAVSDTGIGISESDQRVIFEEFAQIESSMQRRVKGTGLGLPLSRKLAELLGGAVEVRSTVGEGSTFALSIPAKYESSAPLAESSWPEFDPAQKVILILEDNSETAFIYRRYLEAAGFQTHLVAAISEARKFLTRVRPDAIILDLLLRGETSWDFLRELKSVENPIPVLVMSVTDDERKIFGLGADDYLTKPFQPEAMVDSIVKLTSQIERVRVLMIDDNEVSRYLLRGHIPEAGYEVFEAREGREGIKMAHELKPAIIFLDYYMPDLNGLEVLKDLRSTPELREIPVVLHSTKALDAEELAFFRENTIAIFPKQSLTLPDSALRVRELLLTLASHVSRNTIAHA
ncbi:MAG: ATP-binding protein [Acidobacteriaceae bacterium]|nr:ATP-binding protein [Acidobacteriaceae bacterium]